MRETENVSSCFVPVLTHWALAIALKGKGWLSKTICGYEVRANSFPLQ